MSGSETSSEQSERSGEKKGPLDWALSLFADVRGGEGLTALVLTLDVLLLLVAYYLLKTVREPLILAGGGVELKSYSTAGQAVLLMGFVPLYAQLTKRLSRMTLVTATSVFFASNLLLFYVLALLGVPYLGVAFFLWLGCFSLTVIAQFWSFANDVYTEEQGKRLFAIVGIGASVGAVAGSFLAGKLIEPLGPFPMMLVASAILIVCLGLTWFVNQRESTRKQEKAKEVPIGGKNGFSMILEERYLLLVAAVILLLNLVNTTGEAILDMNILADIKPRIDPALEGKAREDAVGVLVGKFRADFFFWVNLIGAVLQLFFVSRIFKYVGVRAALFSLPAIGLLAYGMIGFAAPAIALVRIAKIAENSCDYSLYNTAKQALWLPTSRAQKYNAKMATDTFIVRVGDLVSGLGVPRLLAMGLVASQLAKINLVVIVLWLVVVVALAREHFKRTSQPKPAAEDAKAAA